MKKTIFFSSYLKLYKVTEIAKRNPLMDLNCHANSNVEVLILLKHGFRFLSVKIFNIFLPISFNICFRCSKEPSHCQYFLTHQF